MLDVDMAKLELKRKTLADIHTETAWKWASRAVAAYQLSRALSGSNRAIKFCEAREYESEAREHASQVNADLVDKIKDAIDQHLVDALLDMVDESKGK